MKSTHIERLLIQWGEWREALDRNDLGYPSRTAESAIGEGRGSGRPGALVPSYFPQGASMRRLDAGIRAMPEKCWREYVWARYRYRASERACARLVHLGRGSLRGMHVEATSWLAGWMSNHNI